MVGAHAVNAKLAIVAVVLDHMNETDQPRLAHFEEMVLIVAFFNVDASPSLIRGTRL